MSLLKKKELTAQVKFSVPIALNERLQKVQEKAEAEGSQVDLDGVMTKALTRAVSDAEKALGLHAGGEAVPGAPAPTARP